LLSVSIAKGPFRRAMSLAQIHVSSVGERTADTEALLQTPTGEAVSRVRVKVGIVGSVILVGAAMIFVVAPTWVPVSTSIDVPQQVIHLDGVFTTPYYKQGSFCPEGEMITDKEVCRAAGAMLGFGGSFKDKSSKFMKKACSIDFQSTAWNTNFDSRETSGESICKRKPEGMPDFAALKADFRLLNLHCLGKTNDFVLFKHCITEINAWSDSDEAPSRDDEETADAPDSAPENEAPADPAPAPENEPAAAPDCWKKNADTYAGGYAGGVSSKFDIDAAKAKCMELGSSKCGAVTCNADGVCTVRSSTELKPSPNSEVSYTYTC